MAKKRANGEGNLRKRKDGRWEGRYTAGQWAETWFENYAKPSIRETTAAYYKNYIGKHIVPNIGKIKLNKLTTLDIQKFYNKAKAKGQMKRYEGMKDLSLSAKAIHGLHAMLRQCLDQAVLKRLIPYNPAAGCKLPPDGCFCLRPVKTLKSVRVIDVPDLLHDHLKEKFRQQKKHPTQAYRMRASEIVLDKTKSRVVVELQGGDFINRKENGELLTINSIKYYSKKIKADTGIDFNFHALRKTHLTYLANLNIPAIEVMNRAGHKKFETTMKYYINQSEESRRQLINALNGISTEERYVEAPDGYGGTQLVLESRAKAIAKAGALIPH